MHTTNQNPENVSGSEKFENKSPEVTSKWRCSKYADCRGYMERPAAFFSAVLVCLDTISHAVCGAISYQLARPGPSHKTQKSISPVDTGTMTPHTHIPQIPHTGPSLEGLVSEASSLSPWPVFVFPNSDDDTHDTGESDGRLPHRCDSPGPDRGQETHADKQGADWKIKWKEEQKQL